MDENHSSISSVREERLMDAKELFDSLGLDFNSGYVNDWKILQGVIQSGCLKTVEDLLCYGVDINMKSKPNKRTLLHAATISMQEKVVRLLIKYGADVNAEDVHNRAPLFYAILKQNWQIIELLLTSGAEIKDHHQNPYLLSTAIKMGSLKIMEIMLQRKCFDVNGRDSFGRTPLHWTVLAHRGRLDDVVSIARLLLSRGASANVRCAEGKSAFHVAIEEGCVELVEILLEYGADINSLLGEETPLHVSVTKSNKAVIKMLLQKGAIVNAKTKYEKTALHIAAEHAKYEAVKILLEYGADVNSKTDDGITPLHLADKGHHLEIVKYLIQFGADVNSIKACVSTACCKRRNRNGANINIKCKCNVLPCTNTLVIALSDDQNKIYSETANIIVRHIALLNAEHLFVNSKYLQIIDAGPKMKQHYASCEREIRNMKNEQIGNTNVSFYHILIKDVNQIAKYARNENIAKVFKSRGYFKKFPIYADLLASRFDRGRRRQCLLKSSLDLANSLFRYELPYICKEKIFSYLTNLDLKCIADACPYDTNDKTEPS